MKKKIEVKVETVVVTEDGYEGGGEHIALVILPDQKIVFKPGKNIHLTSKTLSLTVGRGASIQTAPGSDLYAVHIDGKIGGALVQLTIQKGGTIGTQVTTVALKTALDLEQVENQSSFSGKSIAYDAGDSFDATPATKVNATGANFEISFAEIDFLGTWLNAATATYSNADVFGQLGSANVVLRDVDSSASYSSGPYVGQVTFNSLIVGSASGKFTEGGNIGSFSNVQNISATAAGAGFQVRYATGMDLNHLRSAFSAFTGFDGNFQSSSTGAKISNIMDGTLANDVITAKSFTIKGETYYNSLVEAYTGEIISQGSRFRTEVVVGAIRSRQNVTLFTPDSGNVTTITTVYSGITQTHPTATAQIEYAVNQRTNIVGSIRTGYTSNTLDAVGTLHNVKNGAEYSAGVKYQVNPVLGFDARVSTQTVGAVDERGRTTHIDLGAQFKVGNLKVEPTLEFNSTKLDDREADGIGYDIAVAYNLSKSTNLYAEYYHLNADGQKMTTENNQAIFGIRLNINF